MPQKSPPTCDGKIISQYRDFLIVNEPPASERIKNYKQLAGRAVPENLRTVLPTSFDIIGDIALIKIPQELGKYSKEVGDAILGAYKSIRVVARDGGVAGELRKRSLDIIAGENRTVTTHKEYGISLEVDLAHAYFSPRLATERWRVAQQVAEGECVVDMFAGVGPFSIMIAKHRKPQRVYAIDINPSAIEYLKKNTKINKVEEIVTPFLGDSARILPEIAKRSRIDRIIMNLPWKSFDFLGAALGAVAGGGTIHFYEIRDKDEIEPRLQDIASLAKDAGRQTKIPFKRSIKSYSPAQENYVLDIRMK